MASKRGTKRAANSSTSKSSSADDTSSTIVTINDDYDNDSLPPRRSLRTAKRSRPILLDSSSDSSDADAKVVKAPAASTKKKSVAKAKTKGGAKKKKKDISDDDNGSDTDIPAAAAASSSENTDNDYGNGMIKRRLSASGRLALYVDDDIDTPSDRVAWAKGFKLPTSAQRIAAATVKAKRTVPNTDTAGDDRWYQPVADLFPPVPPPVYDDDWLAQMKEDHETFDTFLDFVTLRSGKFKPSANPAGSTIYLLPLGADLGVHVDTSALVAYTMAFFGLANVTMLPHVDIEQDKSQLFWHEPGSKYRYPLPGRCHAASGRHQLKVDSILSMLAKQRSDRQWAKNHPDAFCIMAITMEDLYDTAPDLFVAGMAAGGSKVAVFSFARYQPEYLFCREKWWQWHMRDDGADKKKATKGKKKVAASSSSSSSSSSSDSKEEKKYDAERGVTMLRRSAKLLVHELGHIYGVGHCVWYHCVMNGSGHLAEDHTQPFHLCPVDLRKFQARIGFDPSARYRALSTFYHQHDGFATEAAWVDKLIAAMASSSIVL